MAFIETFLFMLSFAFKIILFKFQYGNLVHVYYISAYKKTYQ